MYLDIISMFQDNQHAQFGLQNICRVAQKVFKGYKPGDWFGPHMISVVLQQIINEQSQMQDHLHVYLCQNGCVFFSEIEQIIRSGKSVLVLIPVKLGLNQQIEQYYSPQIADLFKFTQNVGIIGGDQQSKSSYYFVGEMTKKQDNKMSSELLYLDPHIIQDVVPILDNIQQCQTFHSTSVNFMNFEKQIMASSLVPGFYLNDLNNFEIWKSQLILMQKRYKINFAFSLFFDNPRQVQYDPENTSS